MRLIRILRSRRSLVLIMVFGLGLIIRIYHLGTPSLSGDESIGAIRAFWMYHGLIHRVPTDFYGLIVHSRPPMDIFMSVPAFFIGASEFIIRLPYTIFFLISAILLSIYISLREGWRTGALIFLTLSISPMTVGWSRLATVDSLELGVGCLLIIMMDVFYNQKSSRSLILLAIGYGLSFWFIETFVLLLPLASFLVIKFRRRLSKRTILIAVTIFTLIIAVVWGPRIYFFLFDPRITKIGFGYQVAKLKLPDPIGNFKYYLSTYFSQSIVWIFICFTILGAIKKTLLKNSLLLISSTYIALYLAFFLLIFWSHQAYLGNVYVPLVVVSVITIKYVVAKKLRTIIWICLVVVMLSKTLLNIQRGNSGTPSIWGFRKSDSLRQAAYLVRSCSSHSATIKTDIDGYTAALYFDRRERKINNKTNLQLSEKPEVVYLHQNSRIDDETYPIVFRYLDGSTLYLKDCDNRNLQALEEVEEKSLEKKFLETFWKNGDVISFYR